MGGRRREGGRDELTPQEGTAIRAAVQFFDPVGIGRGAVAVCAVASAALKSMQMATENFIVKIQRPINSSMVFSFLPQLHGVERRKSKLRGSTYTISFFFLGHGKGYN